MFGGLKEDARFQYYQAPVIKMTYGLPPNDFDGGLLGIPLTYYYPT